MLFTGHLNIFAITFIYNESDREISMPLRKHIQVSMVKNLTCGSLFFWIYTPWKIGFLASPKTSLKQVFWVKRHNLFITDQNLVIQTVLVRV
jgi:hypothetical protein